MPSRIQRKRIPGWRTPECSCGCGKPARYVGRPTKFGNPWRVVSAGTEPGLFGGREPVFTVDGPGHFFRGTYSQREAAHFAVDLYCEWINHRTPRFRDCPDPFDATVGLRELAGHDLSCFCPLDQPCHSTILLELANPGVTNG